MINCLNIIFMPSVRLCFAIGLGLNICLCLTFKTWSNLLIIITILFNGFGKGPCYSTWCDFSGWRYWTIPVCCLWNIRGHPKKMPTERKVTQMPTRSLPHADTCIWIWYLVNSEQPLHWIPYSVRMQTGCSAVDLVNGPLFYGRSNIKYPLEYN